jgi:3'-5' exonuclease
MSIFTIDIETAPAQNIEILEQLREDATREKDALKAPSNYKDEAKIAEYIAAKALEIDADLDQRYRKTALDGAYGQIVCIGVAVDDEEPQAFYRADWKTSEKDVLSDTFAYLRENFDPTQDRRPVFVGHNITGFDLRFIYQRSVVNSVVPPSMLPLNAKSWSESIADTMTMFAGFGNRISLDKLCRVLGIESSKDGIDGSKVYDYLLEGKIDEVAAYCKRDIEATREIYRRLSFTW